MPRYFFNVHDGKDIEDIDGTVLSDEGHARKQAIVTAAEIAGGNKPRTERDLEWAYLSSLQTSARTFQVSPSLRQITMYLPNPG